MSTDVYDSPNADLTSPGGTAEPLSTNEILFSFRGRIGRKTFWLASLGFLVVYAVLFGVLTAILPPEIAMVVLGVLYIPVLWISFALQTKRWHDRNKSAWWILMNFVPLIGGIWVFIEVGCLKGTEGENNYGPAVV